MITRDPLKVPCLTDKYWASSRTVTESISRALYAS